MPIPKLRPVKVLGYTVHILQKLDKGKDHPRAAEYTSTPLFYNAAWKTLGANEKVRAQTALKADVAARNATKGIKDNTEFSQDEIDRAVASLEG